VIARRRSALAVLAAAIAVGLAAPAAGLAHGAAEVVPPGEEHALRAAETAALGSAHAREHAAARRALRRRAARLQAMAPRERRRWDRSERARDDRLTAAAQATVADAAKNEIGEWSGRFGLPDYVMHAALLHTGEVAMWGWLPYQAGAAPGDEPRRPLRGENWFWDTSKPLPELTGDDSAGAFREDDAPQIAIGGETQTPPLYCSGISFLPDGRLVIAGGNLAFTEDEPENGKGWKGLDTLFVYDPETEQWSQGPTMQHGRWYPTQVMLADGRTLVTGGYDESGSETLVEDSELLSAAGDAFATLPSPATDMEDTWGDVGWPGLYPHAWVMPGGKVLIVPREWSRASALLDPDTLDFAPDALDPWTERPEKEGATAVLMPNGAAASDEIVQLGGFAYFDDDGATPDGVAAPAVRSLDQDELESASPWQERPSLNVGRSYHNTVLLPGGGLVTVGGGAGNDPDPDPDTSSGLYYDGGGQASLLNAELYDPATGGWTLGAPQQSFRAYHSVALLLPDGRVWSAGDDWHQDAVSAEAESPWRGNAEIFSPPYLFGAVDPAGGGFDPDRPAQRTELAGAPARLGWGDTAAVTTSSDDVSKLVLMAPSAVTHSIDTNQRHVELEIAARSPGTGVTVTLPGDATTAPPGWYMLFAVNRCGTPSHAKWLRVAAAAPGDPPPGEPTPATGPRAGAAACSAADVPSPPAPTPPAAPTPPNLVATPLSPPLPLPPPKALPWRVTLAAPRAARGRILDRRKVSVLVRANGPGRVRVRALLKRRGAPRLAVGKGSLTFKRAGRATLAIAISKAGLAALSRGPSTLVLEATGAGKGGAKARTVVKRPL
jgi:hypothetical protein